MNKIRTYKDFVTEGVSSKNVFDELYTIAPTTLQKIVDDTENAQQSEQWHPEGNTLIHIKLVTNRLHNKYHDINLTLGGFFHDLGKAYTTVWNEEKNDWGAIGHEIESSKIVRKFSTWIKTQGGDPEIVDFIVTNHMRMKFLGEFRTQAKLKLFAEPYFDYLHKFTSSDFGGTELEAREPMDLTKAKEQTELYNKRQEENKIIASKFNGNLLMSLYPELKGISLGKAITGFKGQFDDFNKYAVEADAETILSDFEKFYK